MKEKRELLAKFYDDKGFVYELVNEKKKRLFDRKDEGIQEIKLYQGKDWVQPWDVHKRKVDLSRSAESDVILLIEEYLKSSVNIKTCLQTTLLPFGAVMAVWDGIYSTNQIIKETLLKYQDVLRFPDFTKTLTHKEKWVVLTQNEHRTKELMVGYSDMFEDMVSDFLQDYLSKENIESHELLYGEWRTLIQTTVEQFYGEGIKKKALKRALEKTAEEVTVKTKELFFIQHQIAEMDESYERATISEKLKMEGEMKTLLETERSKKTDIEDTNEKMERIKSFFTKEYLPLSPK